MPEWMKNAGSTLKIDIDALRVGMFIHLDVGWMSHPFPLSSFRITSDQQIRVIRSLRLKQVRWSPEQSALLAAQDQAAPATAASDEPLPGAAAVALEPVESSLAAADPGLADTVPAAFTVTEATAEPEAQEQVVLRERRAAAAAQRAALAVCERQFAEATRECHELTDLVGSQPHAARERVQALSRAFVDKMVGQHDVCVRLLTEAAGDRASTHAVNVALISLLMGRSFGLSLAELEDLGVGALMHDIGKLDMPRRVRHHEEHFSAADTTSYEEHVMHGVAQARRLNLSAGATLVIAQHHEHADGSGFPLKLGSDRMTPASSIVALVNQYDNLCNPHVPSKALTPHEALSLLFAQGKSRFNTTILGAFIKMMGVYPAGSVVQLTDDRFAMVIGVNSSRPLKPRVLVFDPMVPPEEAATVNLEATPHLGIRRSLRPSALPREALDYLSPRQRVAYYFESAAEDDAE
jgi:putative nucleotidyltransferase with HDIG domain